MKNPKNVFPLLLVIFVFLTSGFAQNTLYNFFGESDYIYLKGIDLKISQAHQDKDVKSLCAYAALLFYTEHISKKKHDEVSGITLLREATLIAWKKENIQELQIVQKIWGSNFFGPSDKVSAREIQKKIQKIKKEHEKKKDDLDNEVWEELPTIPKMEEKTEEPKKEKVPEIKQEEFDPQKFLSAEEYARIDALEQIAERVFGVLIQSATNVKDFTVTKDVVISNLKSSLILGAKFGKTDIQGDQVSVPVTVTQAQILASMKIVLIRQKKKLSQEDLEKFSKNLNKEYKSTGIGFMSKE